MKKTIVSKIALCLGIFIMTIVLLQGFSFAQSENIQMIKKSNEEYMIYVEELLEQEFQFAFSNNENKDNLKFYDSAFDKTENGNHIVYIDSEIYNQNFKDKKDVYLWIKQGDVYKMEAQKINLENAISEEDIVSLNQLTKKISVDIGNKDLPVETKDGVTQNVRIGTINITDDKAEKYYYQIVKVVEDTDTAKMTELVYKLNSLEGKNMYEKLSVYSEFKQIYSKIAPKLNEENWWLEVQDYTIEQPADSKKGDKYIVWIKDNSKIDFQIMNCDDDYTPEFENKKMVVKEVTKLPVTGASIALFVALGIILVLIVLVIVVKKNNRKAE